MTNNIIDKIRTEINRRIHNIIRTPEDEEELKRDFPDQYGVVLGYRAVLSILELKESEDEQKPNYCHHEVDLSNCSEEYCKAYYDGWNNCNQQHSQLRAEQKPAWSEEDEERYKSCLQKLGTGNLAQPETINTIWLKSLKERYTWKPSDEQMGVIEAVINNKSFQRRHLDSLYADLKRLRKK